MSPASLNALIKAFALPIGNFPKSVAFLYSDSWGISFNPYSNFSVVTLLKVKSPTIFVEYLSVVVVLSTSQFSFIFTTTEI